LGDSACANGTKEAERTSLGSGFPDRRPLRPFAAQFEIRNSKISPLFANSSVMKKSAAVGIGVGVVLLIAVFAIAFVPARQPVSLTFLQYSAGRDAAKLKLTNNSRKTITYLTDQTGTPVLSLLKSSSGWTNMSPPIVTGTHIETRYGTSTNVVSSTTNQIYLVTDLATLARGQIPETLQTHTLEPGEGAELYVSLEADGPPIRVGTVCIVPQGKLAQQFGHWMDRVKRWCRMKPTVPGQVEVWCARPLQTSSSPVNAEKR